MKATFVFCLLLLVLGQVSPVSAQGTVEEVTFFSPSLGEDRSLQIYLPDGYDPLGETRYQVIYFLHGALNSHLDYPQAIIAMREVEANGEIQKTILVKPDGRTGEVPRIPSGDGEGPLAERLPIDFGGSAWVNSGLYGNFEDYLTQDVIEYIDGNYLTLNTRDRRAVMGHSMGANGSMNAALKHPDLYRGVAAHSGDLEYDRYIDLYIPEVLAENGGVPPYEFDDPFIGGATWTFFLVGGAFSWNLANPPFFVDFPLDEQGELIQSVWDRWAPSNPSQLAEDAQNAGTLDGLGIYFDCGDLDEFLAFGFNESFHEALDSLGIPHRWEPYEGGHSSHLFWRFKIAYNQLDDWMNDVVSVDEATHQIQNRVKAVFPNPLPLGSSAFRISFELDRSERVTLRMFDTQSRHVGTLVEETVFREGRHSLDLPWPKGARASGTYFIRLETPTSRSQVKIVTIQ